MKFKILTCLIFCLFALLNPSIAETNSGPSVTEPLKVGFLMGGPVTDFGWNQAHNDGRLYLEKHMAGKVQTIFAEKVPENAEAARVMEKIIAQGAKVIFTTTYGYLDSVIQVAARHTDVKFMQINRYSDKPQANIGVYFPYYFETFYANGIVAGRMTKSNQIGFIVGHAVPNVLAAVNAFTLGARSVNPQVKVKLVCTNSWNDPMIEAETTKALVEGKADIIASVLDSSLTVCLAADKLKTYSIGAFYDLSNKIPKTWLTGAAWNYGPLYTRVVKQVLDNLWRNDTQYFSANAGYTRIANFGAAVPKSIQDEASSAFSKIKEGKIIVFAGPIKDSTGKLRIPNGKTADNHCIEQMNWVVPGVEGYSSK